MTIVQSDGNIVFVFASNWKTIVYKYNSYGLATPTTRLRQCGKGAMDRIKKNLPSFQPCLGDENIWIFLVIIPPSAGAFQNSARTLQKPQDCFLEQELQGSTMQRECLVRYYCSY